MRESEISLIIPSYNNADELMGELPALLDYLRQANCTVECIVVDDGSSNRGELDAFCKDQLISLLVHDVNQGKGRAVQTGMLHASKSIRVFTDADIPFQYESVLAIIRALRDGQVQVALGDRRNSDYFSQTPMYRRLGSWMFSTLVSACMFRRLGDTQCGLKGFRAEAVPVIFGDQILSGFATDIEWIDRARKAKLQRSDV
ncbi:MAG: glycosyltransferase, partial [Flavobacteriales bacterium]